MGKPLHIIFENLWSFAETAKSFNKKLFISDLSALQGIPFTFRMLYRVGELYNIIILLCIYAYTRVTYYYTHFI